LAQHLACNLGKSNQLTVRHSRVAVYPLVKRGRRNAQLSSQFFPPDSSHHLAEEQLLVRFRQARGQSRSVVNDPGAQNARQAGAVRQARLRPEKGANGSAAGAWFALQAACPLGRQAAAARLGRARLGVFVGRLVLAVCDVRGHGARRYRLDCTVRRSVGRSRFPQGIFVTGDENPLWKSWIQGRSGSRRRATSR